MLKLGVSVCRLRCLYSLFRHNDSFAFRIYSKAFPNWTAFRAPSTMSNGIITYDLRTWTLYSSRTNWAYSCRYTSFRMIWTSEPLPIRWRASFVWSKTVRTSSAELLRVTRLSSCAGVGDEHSAAIKIIGVGDQAQQVHMVSCATVISWCIFLRHPRWSLVKELHLELHFKVESLSVANLVSLTSKRS